MFQHIVSTFHFKMYLEKVAISKNDNNKNNLYFPYNQVLQKCTGPHVARANLGWPVQCWTFRKKSWGQPPPGFHFWWPELVF